SSRRRTASSSKRRASPRSTRPAPTFPRRRATSWRCCAAATRNGRRNGPPRGCRGRRGSVAEQALQQLPRRVGALAALAALAGAALTAEHAFEQPLGAAFLDRVAHPFGAPTQLLHLLAQRLRLLQRAPRDAFELGG